MSGDHPLLRRAQLFQYRRGHSLVIVWRQYGRLLDIWPRAAAARFAIGIPLSRRSPPPRPAYGGRGPQCALPRVQAAQQHTGKEPPVEMEAPGSGATAIANAFIGRLALFLVESV